MTGDLDKFCFITGTFWAGGEKKSKHAQKT